MKEYQKYIVKLAISAPDYYNIDINIHNKYSFVLLCFCSTLSL